MPSALRLISIHALLAESDAGAQRPVRADSISIHALLAESDLPSAIWPTLSIYFYPRSPCGERPPVRVYLPRAGGFLSTLSLRRATFDFFADMTDVVKFLSTLSLRRATAEGERVSYTYMISIHALLAESDVCRIFSPLMTIPFLSTLSLRRATEALNPVAQAIFISIHALLAESDPDGRPKFFLAVISIHALLAESDALCRYAMV